MNRMNGYDVEDLSVGMSAPLARTITEADIVPFVGASGDNNAVQINQEFAATTPFKSCIRHGMLTASVISAAIANKLSGPGTICARARSSRRQGVPGIPSGQTVSVREMLAKKRLVWLTRACTVTGTVVITGEALVKVGSRG
jgi:3-hydroxybutyryl-CoA dehydratase